MRQGRAADLPALTPLAGSADRAWWRVELAASGDEVLLVAEAAGALVGAVSVRRRGDCDGPHPWLYGLHVRADARRRGTGALLVRAAEREARAQGARAVSLDVDRDDDALLGWYARLGYVRVRPHAHRWSAVDPATRAVVATGTSPTWVLRRTLADPLDGPAQG